MSAETTITVVAGDGEDIIEPVTATVTVIGTVGNGPPGIGIPEGGDENQVLAKASDDDFDTEWVDQTGGPGGGAPTDATYLVTTSNGDLSAEVVVGATPGGELGGTWASPTVDATHSGSSHASVQAAAEATASADATAKVAAEAALARNADNLNSGTVADARIASTIARDSEVTAAVAAEATLARNADNLTSGTVADARIASTIARDSEVTAAISAHEGASDPHPGYLTAAEGNAAYDAAGAASTVNTALNNHLSDTSDAHDASAISIADTANDFTATDVEGALAELQSDHETDAQNLADHIADSSDAHDASAISFTPHGSIAATDVQAAIQEVRDEAGSGSFPDHSGEGSPEGVVEAGPGESYVDTLNGGIWFKRTGSGDTGWFGGADGDGLTTFPGDVTQLAGKFVPFRFGEIGKYVDEIDAWGFPGFVDPESDDIWVSVVARDGNSQVVAGNAASAAGFDVLPDRVLLFAAATPGQTSDLFALRDENADPAFTVAPDGTTEIASGLTLAGQIHGVSDGVAADDAATVGQLEAAIDDLDPYLTDLQTQTAILAAERADEQRANSGYYVGAGGRYSPSSTSGRLDVAAGMDVLGVTDGPVVAATAIGGGSSDIADFADATHPKWVRIERDTSGVTQFNQGTAAAAPAIPDLTAGRVPVGRIYVPAGATEVDELLTTNNGKAKLYADARVVRPGPSITGWCYDTNTAPVWVSGSSLKYTGVDLTGTFAKGMKYSVYDGTTVNHFVIASVTFSTDTTLTFISTYDFVLANATLSRVRFAVAGSPQGFPTWFAWAPNLSGWGPNPSHTAALTSVTTTVSSNIFTKTSHGLTDGTPISIHGLTNTTGITANTVTYFVVGATANTFQIALTKGGSAIDLTGADDTGLTVSTITGYKWRHNSGTALLISVRQGQTGTSSASSHTVSLPVAAATVTPSSYIWQNTMYGAEGGTGVASMMFITSGGSTVALARVSDSVNATSGTSRQSGALEYQF